MFGTCCKGFPTQLSLRDPADQITTQCLGKLWGDHRPAPARGLCQAGRRFPHHDKQCPENHWGSARGSAIFENLPLSGRVMGAAGEISPSSRNKERTFALVKAAAPDPSLSLSHRKGRGGSEGSGAGALGEAEAQRQEVREPRRGFHGRDTGGAPRGTRTASATST